MTNTIGKVGKSYPADEAPSPPPPPPPPQKTQASCNCGAPYAPARVVAAEGCQGAS